MKYNPMNVFYLYVVSSVFHVFQVYLHGFRYHLYKIMGKRERKI